MSHRPHRTLGTRDRAAARDSRGTGTKIDPSLAPPCVYLESDIADQLPLRSEPQDLEGPCWRIHEPPVQVATVPDGQHPVLLNGANPQVVELPVEAIDTKHRQMLGQGQAPAREHPAWQIEAGDEASNRRRAPEDQSPGEGIHQAPEPENLVGTGSGSLADCGLSVNGQRAGTREAKAQGNPLIPQL